MDKIKEQYCAHVTSNSRWTLEICPNCFSEGLQEKFEDENAIFY